MRTFTYDQVRQEVLRLLEEYGYGSLSEEACFDDHGLDSLARLELLTGIEGICDVELDRDNSDDLATVRQVIMAVMSALKKSRSRSSGERTRALGLKCLAEAESKILSVISRLFATLDLLFLRLTQISIKAPEIRFMHHWFRP